MENLGAAEIGNITARIRRNGLRTYLINKIKHANKHLPSNLDWNDFDVSLRLYTGSLEYLSNKYTEILVRVKEDDEIKRKYTEGRIKVLDTLTFKMSNIYLGDILLEYGFNDYYSEKIKDDVKDRLLLFLDNGFDVTDYQSTTDERYTKLYFSLKHFKGINDSYTVTAVDNPEDDKREDDLFSTNKFSGLLTVARNEYTEQLPEEPSEPHGYYILFVKGLELPTFEPPVPPLPEEPPAPPEEPVEDL